MTLKEYLKQPQTKKILVASYETHRPIEDILLKEERYLKCEIKDILEISNKYIMVLISTKGV